MANTITSDTMSIKKQSDYLRKPALKLCQVILWDFEQQLTVQGSWRPHTQLSTPQPNTLSSGKVSNCKRTGGGRPQMLRRTSHFRLQWIWQNLRRFRETHQKHWRAPERCSLQGEGTLWAGFWSILPRKSSSLLQAPIALATPLIPP